VFGLLNGSIWTAIKRAVGGGPFQFETERDVIGTRGTTFSISHDRARNRTTVRVFEGAVEFWRRSTPKRKLLVKAGQTAVRQGNRQPRITKR
jgi:ferric-dicitrate binding protein FerR (iron transport regulator)